MALVTSSAAQVKRLSDSGWKTLGSACNEHESPVDLEIVGGEIYAAFVDGPLNLADGTHHGEPFVLRYVGDD